MLLSKRKKEKHYVPEYVYKNKHEVEKKIDCQGIKN